MRIATWNINGLNARIDFVLHWLRARQPDVVGLQELKTADDKFPYMAFEAEGYHAVAHGQKAWNGVAILSRKPCEVLQVGLPGQEDSGSRLVTARIDDLDFTTIYLPNGKTVDHQDFPKKLAWLDSLIARSETEYVSDYAIAMAHLALEQHEKAIETLMRSHEQNEPLRLILYADPFIDPIRDDPRMQAIFRDLMFEEYK